MKKIIIFCIIAIIILTTLVSANTFEQLTAYIANFRVFIDNEEKEFENPIVTINGRTYIPLRELGEVFGMNVEWCEKSQSIFISDLENYEWRTLYRFEKDGLWGYRDDAGNVIIEPQFAFARNFHEGLAFVSKELHSPEFRGYIDLSGELVIPLPTVSPILTGLDSWGFRAWDFQEGFAVVSIRDWDFGNEPTGGVVGPRGPSIFIDRTGQNVFGQEFIMAGSFSEGVAAVTPITVFGGYSIFIDKTGQNAFNKSFRHTSAFRDGYANVTLNDGTQAVIDRSGNIVDNPRPNN